MRVGGLGTGPNLPRHPTIPQQHAARDLQPAQRDGRLPNAKLEHEDPLRRVRVAERQRGAARRGGRGGRAQSSRSEDDAFPQPCAEARGARRGAERDLGRNLGNECGDGAHELVQPQRSVGPLPQRRRPWQGHWLGLGAQRGAVQGADCVELGAKRRCRNASLAQPEPEADHLGQTGRRTGRRTGRHAGRHIDIDQIRIVHSSRHTSSNMCSHTSRRTTNHITSRHTSSRPLLRHKDRAGHRAQDVVESSRPHALESEKGEGDEGVHAQISESGWQGHGCGCQMCKSSRVGTNERSSILESGRRHGMVGCRVRPHPNRAESGRAPGQVCSGAVKKQQGPKLSFGTQQPQYPAVSQYPAISRNSPQSPAITRNPSHYSTARHLRVSASSSATDAHDSRRTCPEGASDASGGAACGLSSASASPAASPARGRSCRNASSRLMPQPEWCSRSTSARAAKASTEHSAATTRSSTARSCAPAPASVPSPASDVSAGSAAGGGGERSRSAKRLSPISARRQRSSRRRHAPQSESADASNRVPVSACGGGGGVN